MPRFRGSGGRVKRFISRGRLVSSSRTFVAKREKVIIVENITVGPLREVWTSFPVLLP